MVPVAGMIPEASGSMIPEASGMNHDAPGMNHAS